MIKNLKIYYSFVYLKPKKRKQSIDYIEDNVFVDIPEYHGIPDVLYIKKGNELLDNYKFIDGVFYHPYYSSHSKKEIIELHNQDYVLQKPSIQDFVDGKLQDLLKQINNYNSYQEIEILKDLPIHRKKISDNLLEVEQFIKNIVSNKYCLIDGILYKKTNEPKLSFRNCLFWNYSMGNHIISNKNGFHNSFDVFNFSITNYNLLKHIASEITKIDMTDTLYHYSAIENITVPNKIIYAGQEIIFPNNDLLNMCSETPQDIYNEIISFFQRCLFNYTKETDFVELKLVFDNAKNNDIDGFYLILNSLINFQKKENLSSIDIRYKEQMLFYINNIVAIIKATINGINNYKDDDDKNNLKTINSIVVSLINEKQNFNLK